MPGWNLKNGEITEYTVTEERYWALFNYVFSESCAKRNTYKFGLIKSLLDNLFNMLCTDEGIYIHFNDLFSKFTENYWNLVVKYDLRQMRRDNKSERSKIETILIAAVNEEAVLANLEFESLGSHTKTEIVTKVTRECKRYVIGALYNDFDGVLYAFDLNDNELKINPTAYDFMLKYKAELEKLNYYSWAKFLEAVNTDDVLARVIDKLELSTPRRSNLSVYREILRKEFEEDTCFYCGRSLKESVHVDHFIPWTFTKDDKIWNFVLTCPSCNTQKNNRVPARKYLIKIEQRNEQLGQIDNDIVIEDFSTYSEGLIRRMWKYAKLSGIKEYNLAK